MPSLLMLRGGEPPDDAAVVVRGGEHGLDEDVLRRTAERTFEDYGFLSCTDRYANPKNRQHYGDRTLGAVHRNWPSPSRRAHPILGASTGH
jgi:hypothetical protein